MRSGLNGSLTTTLLLVPVLTVPLLAVFGVPEFSQIQARIRKATAAVTADDWNTEVTDKLSNDANTATSSPFDLPPQSEPLTSAPEWGQPPVKTPPNDRKPIPERSLPATSRAASLAGDEFSQEVVPRAEAGPRRATTTNSPRPGNSPAERWANPERTPGGSSSGAMNEASSVKSGGDPRVMPTAGQGNRSANSKAVQTAQFEEVPLNTPAPQGYRRQGEGVKTRTAANADPLQFPAREPLTWQGAVQRLNQLEIRNFRLEPGADPGQFIFICSYTPPENPRVSYRFEAEAHEPLRAVEKVIDQIETWVAQQQQQ